MATEKKNDQTLSVEQRLKALYELQTILSEIDNIKSIRGDLPLEVKDMEDNIARLHTRIDNFTLEIREKREAMARERATVEEAKSKIDIYNRQINDVRNNHEYDMLNKEIEYLKLEIQLAEKHIGAFEREIAAREAEIIAIREQLADQEHILEDKKSELDTIISETRKQEEELREKAKALEPNIDERTLTAFKRIRKNARNGLGIVYVQRNACGGCFNRIPPQKQMEIKMHKKVIVCEYCGRIMIDPALAGVEETSAR